MIKTETITIGGKQFIRTYSDAGRFVVGGLPEGEYIEAIDPVEFSRTYTEGDLIPEDESGVTANELLDIITGVTE